MAGDPSASYFARRVAWDWHDAGTIDLLDGDGAVTGTLDEWQTLVFHAADANTTVGELITGLRRRPPVDADANPIDPSPSVMRALAALTGDFEAVELRDAKSELADEHDLPVSERHLLDTEK